MRKSTKSAPPPSGDRNEFVLSDDSIDRMGDVIDPQGWQLANFKAHPIALFNHDPNQVIGSWSGVRIEGRQLRATLNFADAGTSPLVDTVRALHSQGILRAVSVGFRPLAQEPLNEKAHPDWGPHRFIKSELLECSLVSVPANPHALQVAKSLAIAGETLAEIFTKPGGDPLALQTPRPADASSRHKGITTMNLSQQIEAKQNSINAMRDQLNAIVNKEDRDDDDVSLMGTLPDQVEIAIKDLDQLRKIERVQGMSATPPAPTKEIQAPAVINKNRIRPIERKSDLVIRCAAIHVISHITRKPHDVILRDMYGNDEATGIVLRAASNPATTTQAGWAAELVQTANADFVDTLKPDRVYPQLSRLGQKFTFGRNGAIKIPARASTPTLAGDWIGEGAAIPVKALGFTSVTLTPKKLAVISTMTREIAAHSTPAIEGIIRDAMSEDTSTVIDTKLISADAATTLAPAGLRNGVTVTTASAAATMGAAMVADIGALIGAITAVNGGRSLVLIINPQQAMNMSLVQTTTGDFIFGSTDEAGRRMGVTIIVSSTVPAKMVICVDAADYASVTGDTPEYDVSDQATLHMEDTNPLPIATGAQGSGVLATPTRSLWQTASIGVRFMLDMNWAMRRTGMVSWTQNVLW